MTSLASAIIGGKGVSLSTTPRYQKSSFCKDNGCLEVAALPDGAVAVRDSKDTMRQAPLVFTANEWSTFIAAIKTGQYDFS